MSMMGTAMPAGCWDLDLATGDLKLCPHSRSLFGLGPKAAEVLRESEWIERLHPDDLAVVREAMRACITHQRPYAERFRTIHPDGTVQPVFGIGRPINDEAGRARFLGWNFDPVAAGEQAMRWIAEYPQVMRAENLFSISSAAHLGDEEPQGSIHEDARLERAQSILRVRRSRERVLGRAMLGEPAFDLLLCLYVREEQRDKSLASLAHTAGIPYSSAMRWISYLEDKALVEREQLGRNRRSTPVRLTLAGRAAVDELLSIR
jgi:DNA-binding MarR family transcriptional regulator